MLLKKTLAAKKKALILCPMPAASALDDALWSHDAGSWIAHGLDDADGAEYFMSGLPLIWLPIG
jgi:DNA polymerase IIIc chi subunit